MTTLTVAHHVGQRRSCATCPARVFAYADGAEGVHYCRNCVVAGRAQQHMDGAVLGANRGSLPEATFPAGARVSLVARLGGGKMQHGTVYAVPSDPGAGGAGTVLVLWDGQDSPVVVGTHRLDRSL